MINTQQIKQRYFHWSEILDQIDPAEFLKSRRVSDRLTEKGIIKKFKQWIKQNDVQDVQGNSYQYQIKSYCEKNNINFDMVDVAYLQKENVLNGWIHRDRLKLKEGKKWLHCKQDVEPKWYNVHWVGDFDGVPSVQVESVSRIFGDYGYGYCYNHRYEYPDARPFEEVNDIFINEDLEAILKKRLKFKGGN